MSYVENKHDNAPPSVTASVTDNTPQKERLYVWFLAGGLCLIAVIGAVAPRSLSFLPGVMGVLAFCGHRLVYKAWPSPHMPSFAIALGICLLGLLSSIWGVDPDESIERSYKSLLILMPGALLISSILSAPAAFAERVFKLAPYALLIMLVPTFLELATEGYLYGMIKGVDNPEDINMSSFNRGVVFIAFFTCPAMAAYFLHKPQGIWSRFILPALCALLALGVCILTDSQSAQLALATSLLFFFAYRFIKGWVWKPLQILLITMLFAAPWIAISMFNSLPAILSEYSWFQSAYAMHRMEIWDFVARYALQQPLYGYGMEATKAIQDFDTKMLYFRYPVVLHPHNFALQIWIEFGAIGVLICSGLFYYLLQRIERLPEAASRLSLAMFMSVLCMASTAYGLWQGWFLGAVMLTAVFCTIFTIPKTRDS